MRRAVALAALFLLTELTLAAGIQGLPLIQRYGPRDHHASATHLGVLARADGYVFVGNARGLLRYDGSHWEHLELPGRTSARSLALDHEGRVYLGSYDRFGRAEADATGALIFVDLTDQLREGPDAPPVGQVWSICSNAHGMYVYSDAGLALLRRDGTRRYWPVGPEHRSPYCAREAVYGRIHGAGLSRLEEDGFHLLDGGDVFADAPLYNVFETPAGIMAVGPAGFYRVDGRQLRLIPDTDGHRLADYPPYSGTPLADGSFVFGTYSGELLHFSPALRLLSVHAISPYTIFELSVDHEGGLWAATEGDLLRLRFPSVWSLFSAETGLVGQVYDSAFFEGGLYVATSLGVLRAASRDGVTRFAPAIETELEAAALEPDPAGMLVADRQGILIYRPGEAAPQRLLASDAPSTILRSLKWPRRVYAPARTSLDVLETGPEGWRVVSKVPLGELSHLGIEEAADGSLWLGDSRGGPLRMEFDDAGQLLQQTRFGAADGLQIDPAFGSYVEALDGEIHVISGQRVMRHDAGRFSPTQGAPFSLFDEPFDMVISETAIGSFAYSSKRMLQREPGGSEWRQTLGGSGLAGGYWEAHLDTDGMLRVGSWDGLLQFDPRGSEPMLADPDVRMRSISLRPPDGTLSRLPLRPEGGVQAFPTGGLVQFDFSLPTMEPGAQFRLRIHGMFDQFSEWAPVVSPALNLRVPGPGEYRLEVEGRTPSGRQGAPLNYRFRVLPQWWQQPLARIGGGLLALAVLVGLAMLALRWRYQRYVEINRALEARIAERTAELETANRRLAELATEDELTGVANRRALEQALAREWERCRELGQSLAVVMVDVDRFKQYNDRHGHLAGDRHLVHVAGVLRTQVRSVRELLARFGGEEFVLVLPGAELATAAERAEAMRAAMQADASGTTISLGVAAEVPRAGAPGATAILQRADMALYRAKAAGRNRVELDS